MPVLCHRMNKPDGSLLKVSFVNKNLLYVDTCEILFLNVLLSQMMWRKDSFYLVNKWIYLLGSYCKIKY